MARKVFFYVIAVQRPLTGLAKASHPLPRRGEGPQLLKYHHEPPIEFRRLFDLLALDVLDVSVGLVDAAGP